MLATAPASDSGDMIRCPTCGGILGEWRGELVLSRHAGREWLGRPEAMTCGNKRCAGVWRPLYALTRSVGR